MLPLLHPGSQSNFILAKARSSNFMVSHKGVYNRILTGIFDDQSLMGMKKKFCCMQHGAVGAALLFMGLLPLGLLAQPTVSSFLPVAAATGTPVTIRGTNFKDVLAVAFGNLHAVSYKVINTTTIEAVVGAGSSGKIFVHTLQGTASLSGFTYIVTPPPVITRFAPMQGKPGTTVDITGANFSAVADSNIVYFGGARASITAATPTMLTVTVPAGATYQPISVTTNNLTGYSTKPFILTFDGGGMFTQSSLGPKIDLSTAEYTERCALADLDGDGKNDLIGTIAARGVYLYRNISVDTSIVFQPKIDVPVADGPLGLAVGDLDGDGRFDLVITNHATQSGGTISVLRNTSTPGRISFTPRVTYYTGNDRYSQPENATIADLDGDGRPEVIALNRGSSNLSIFKNYSVKDTIMLTGLLNVTTEQNPQAVSTGDLNGDGKPEIVVANDNQGTVSVLINTSRPDTLSFSKHQDFPAEHGPYSVAVGDLDGDGQADLAVATKSQDYLSVYKNITTNTTTIALADRINYKIGETGSWVSIGDVDGDGKPDLVGGDSYYQNLGVLRNNSQPGTIAFDPRVLFAHGPVNCISLGDLDGDGAPEIATATGVGGSLALWRNKVPGPHIGSFSPRAGGAGSIITITGSNFSNAARVSFGSVPAASFTVVSPTTIRATLAAGASGNISITTPRGTDTLTGFRFSSAPVITSFFPSSGPIGTQVTITGTNFSPVAAGNTVYFGPVKATVLQASDSALVVAVPPGANLSPLSVTAGNLTGYAAKGFNVTFPGSPAVFLPTSFSKKDIAASFIPGQLTAADIDGDGKTDLVLPDVTENTLSVYLNTSIPGNVSFATPVKLSAPSALSIIKMVDLDGDGKQDIVAAGSKVLIFRNISNPGNLAFDTRLDYPVTDGASLLTVADFNADGKPDIVTAAYGVFQLLKNTSTGTSLTFVKQVFNYTSRIPKAIATGDFNADGRPELILSDYYNNIVSIFPNISSDTLIYFAAQIDYPVGSAPYEGISTADVNADNKPDIALVNFNGTTVSVLINTSQAAVSFRSQVLFPTNIHPGNLCTEDLDGDGRPDIAAVHNDYNSGLNINTVALLKNKGDTSGLFAPKVSYEMGRGTAIYYQPAGPFNGIWSSDLDGDGKPDLAVPVYVANKISILRNKINEPNTIASGSNPVSGNITSRLTFDSSVQSYNGVPYVQRHYDIEPENNAATATATVTLYFSQQDFNNFNAYPAHGTDLPKNPSDNSGKANLRVFQYHGFSTTSKPDSYSGPGVEIDPDDQKIVWNPTAQWWEVSFDVTGFSGFFVGTAGKSILPVQLLSFTAALKGDQATLRWRTAQEKNFSHFTLQRSTDGAHFTTIGKITALGNSNINTEYLYIDTAGTAPIYYYRLLLTDRDGSFSTSKVITVTPAKTNFSISVYPNPATEHITIGHPAAGHAAEVSVLDMGGKKVRSARVGANSTQTKVNIQGLSSGVYKAVWTDGEKTAGKTFFCR